MMIQLLFPIKIQNKLVQLLFCLFILFQFYDSSSSYAFNYYPTTIFINRHNKIRILTSAIIKNHARILNNRYHSHHHSRRCRRGHMMLSDNNNDSLFVGFDLGTSGARISIISKTTKQQDTTSSSSSSQSCIDDDDTAKYDKTYHEIFSDSVIWNYNNLGNYDNPNAWMDSIYQLFQKVKDHNMVNMKHIKSICFSGTSASCLLVKRKMNRNNEETTSTINRPYDIIEPSRNNARMYNYNVQNKETINIIQKCVPKLHTASSTTSSLAKLLEYHIESPIIEHNHEQHDVLNQEYLCHQADYVSRQFLQYNNNEKPFTITSDWHNCLKLGYDVCYLQYPEWLIQTLRSGCHIKSPELILPNPIISPGQSMGNIRHDIATFLGLNNTTQIIAGTTDSNAAFFAAISSSLSSKDKLLRPGIAVTSLGSTLAIKHLSLSYVEDSNRGVYSHRFPSTLILSSSSSSSNDEEQWWLVGGASNVGCAILRQLQFTNDEINNLSMQINSNTDSPYHYYPLLKRGERFPISDPMKEPIIEPIPDNRKEYLHGILQGITNVERDGYIVLGQLGCIPMTPYHILTCGGGSQNVMWNHMRQRIFRKSFSNIILKQHDDDDDDDDGNTKTELPIMTISDNDDNDDNSSSSVIVTKANNIEASYGAAILAASTF